MSLKITTYTGGMASTTAYLIESSAGVLVIDAPEGTLDYLKRKKIRPAALALTHGHFDHIWDATLIAREFSCPVLGNHDDDFLFENPSEQLRLWGIPDKIEPAKPTRYLKDGDVYELGEWKFDILHIPGHCPGSILYYEKSQATIFGGDVLFSGSIGRTDLPGGSHEALISGIKSKLMTLPDATTIYPGHGYSTTIGEERANNPYIQ